MNLRNINRRIRNFAKSDFKKTHEYQVQQDILRNSPFGKYNRRTHAWEFKNIANQKMLKDAVETYMYQVPILPELKSLSKELGVEPTEISDIAQATVDALKNRIGSEYIQYALAEVDWDYKKLNTRELVDRINLINNEYTADEIQELKNKWVAHRGL